MVALDTWGNLLDQLQSRQAEVDRLIKTTSGRDADELRALAKKLTEHARFLDRLDACAREAHA